MKAETMESHPIRRVIVYAMDVTHYIETVVTCLAWHRDVCVTLLTNLDLDNVPKGREHPWGIKRLRMLKGLEIQGYGGGSPSISSDHLLIAANSAQGIRSAELDRLVGSAKAVSLLWMDYRGAGLRGVVRDIVRSYPYCLYASSMLIQHRKRRWLRFISTYRQVPYMPYVHPQFLSDKELRDMMFNRDQEKASVRRWRIGFIGSVQPPERSALLDKLYDCLINDHGLWHDVPDGVAVEGLGHGHRDRGMIWVTYGGVGDSKPRGLAPDKYISAIENMEICLCPLGYQGVWTHRVVECLLKGVIPITEDVGRYNLGLKDGINCIVVHSNDWKGAVARALEPSDEEIAIMRERIVDAIVPQLAMRAYASHLLTKLNISCESAITQIQPGV